MVGIEFTEFESDGTGLSDNAFTFAPEFVEVFGGKYYFAKGVVAGLDTTYNGANFGGFDNHLGSEADSRFLVNAAIAYKTKITAA